MLISQFKYHWLPATDCVLWRCLRYLVCLVFVVVASNNLKAFLTELPQSETETPTEVDWNSPNLIVVENALLKTIESTRIAAGVAGRIANLDVVEGALLKANQMIGKIDDKSVQLQLERAKLAAAIARHKSSNQIDLQLAEKRALVAKNEMERAEAANARVANSFPPKEIDRLRLVHDSTQLEIERALYEQRLLGLESALMENDQKMAEELIARHQVLSPGNGMVVSISKRRGEWVEPGTELLEIVKLDRLRIEGFIPASYSGVGLVDRQAQVSIQIGQRSLVLPAKVVFVYPEVNPVSNQVRIHLEVNNTDGVLSPGLRVRAAILPVIP